MRRYELTDAQWERIEDLFPEQIMGRPRLSDRRVLRRHPVGSLLRRGLARHV